MSVPSWVTDAYTQAARRAVRSGLSDVLPGGRNREGAIEDEAEALADVLAEAAAVFLDDRHQELRRQAA